AAFGTILSPRARVPERPHIGSRLRIGGPRRPELVLGRPHSWLYLNSLDNIRRLRSLVEFFVASHNAEMPHAAFRDQTPDEVFFSTAAGLREELAKARRTALHARLAANRAASRPCTIRSPPAAAAEIPP